MIRVTPPTNWRLSSQSRLRQGSSWLVCGVDQAHAVAVLAVDLASGVHDEQLAVIVGQHEGVHAERAVGADATGDVVDEARHDLTGGGVQRGQGTAGAPR